MSTLKCSVRAMVVTAFAACAFAFVAPATARAQFNSATTPVITSVSVVQDTVSQGEHNVLVTVTISNPSNAFYRLEAGGLTMTGASTTSDYRVRAVPGQNYLVVPGTQVQFQTLVTVSATAPLGLTTIDAHANLKFVLGPVGMPTRVGLGASVVKDTWTVVP
jgi:hypothetical protein